MSELEIARALAFIDLLMEELDSHQIARALERFELVCEQRGWAFPERASIAA